MAPAPPESSLLPRSMALSENSQGAPKPTTTMEALPSSPHDQSPAQNASESRASGSMSSVHSKSSLNKYSLFPAQSASKEVIEASLPTLVAARAIQHSRPSFPDMEQLSKRGAPSKWHSFKQLVSKKSTIGTQLGATSFKQESKLPQFEKGKFLRSTSGSNSVSQQPPMKSSLEDEVSDLIQLENPPKLIRRIRSETGCSPKHSGSRVDFPNAVRPLCASLPRTLMVSSNQIQQTSSVQTFPAREDSLKCTNVTNQTTNARISSEKALCDMSSPDHSLHTPQDVSFAESDMFMRGEEDDSYSSLDAYYEEYIERNSDTGRERCGSSDHPKKSAHNKVQYTPFDPIEKVKVSNLTYSASDKNSATDLIPLGHQRNRQVRRNLAIPWSRTTHTGSPSPRSVESENVPRGILDNFIQSLAQTGHENAYGYGGGGSREAFHAQTEALEALELAEDLAVVRQTISTTLEGDETLNFDTTVSLADFLLHSLDTFTSNLWAETKKVNDRRHVLEEKKQKLVQAIESAQDARILLQEEKESLQNEQVDILKESLRLIQVYQDQ